MDVTEPEHPAAGMARCHACQPNEDFAGEEILHHLRLMHPEKLGDGIACWPDGSPAIVDLTLEPGDFDG